MDDRDTHNRGNLGPHSRGSGTGRTRRLRVDSAGMVLSQSDLLLSIATAQWQERDARQEIHQFVDELNGVHHGFDFSKDLVLKTGLVLTDASDIRFRVQNFHRTNMEPLEAEWSEIAQALMTAAQLLARFGSSARTLPSNSILIPLADWLHRNGQDHRSVTAVAHRGERERIRSWVLRSQLEAGVFGSGLDTLLARLRRAIRENPGPAFPVEALDRHKSWGPDPEKEARRRLDQRGSLHASTPRAAGP